MNVRVMTFTLLFIFSPYLAAGLFDKIVKDVGDAVVKELDNVTDSVAPNNKQSASNRNTGVSPQKNSDLPNCPSDQNRTYHNCYGSKDKYVGEWKDDKRHGQGTLTFASGTNYVGEWKDGKMNGQGVYTWGTTKEHIETVPEEKYVGAMKDGSMYGKGTMTYRDGTVKSGYWAVNQVSFAIEYLGDSESEFAKYEANAIHASALKDHYEYYFMCRACNDLNTAYLSNAKFGDVKKAIRAIDTHYKNKGVDSDKVYKDAEENPSEQIGKNLALFKTIKLMGGGEYSSEVRTMCQMYGNGLVMLADETLAKENKGKKDF